MSCGLAGVTGARPHASQVPLFFPQANLGSSPHMAKYMRRGAERPAFVRAFGEGHARAVKDSVSSWLAAPPAAAGGSPADVLKKLLG